MMLVTNSKGDKIRVPVTSSQISGNYGSCYTLMITESNRITKNLSPTLLSAAYLDTICGTTPWPILSRVGDSDVGDNFMFATLW